MSFRRIAEGRIREAMEQGVFENLPGAGKPLDLEEYFNTPEDRRMAFSILKNANCPPPEVELLKEVARLEQAVAETAEWDRPRIEVVVKSHREGHRYEAEPSPFDLGHQILFCIAFTA